MRIKPSNWGQVRGPVGAIHMSAQRIDWKVKGEHQDDQGRWGQLDATRWMDDRNTVIQLTRMAPKMLRHMLKASIDRKEQRSMATKLTQGTQTRVQAHGQARQI